MLLFLRLEMKNFWLYKGNKGKEEDWIGDAHSNNSFQFLIQSSKCSAGAPFITVDFVRKEEEEVKFSSLLLPLIPYKEEEDAPPKIGINSGKVWRRRWDGNWKAKHKMKVDGNGK
jgi:hypothetical protein